MAEFKREPKEKTTETSVEPTMKKQAGGLSRVQRPMIAPLAAGRTMGPRPITRKKGGEVESASEHKAEMKKMVGLEKELRSHEKKPASKGHKGLKTGGVANAQGGYKTGGVVNGQAGYKTGGVVHKYKDGGHVEQHKMSSKHAYGHIKKGGMSSC
jgi:hypothetical protein